jgi:putative transcriptional regulator
MNRIELITSVRNILLKAGFSVSEPHVLKSISFDLAARKDDTLLILKVLMNVDAFSKENARELRLLSGLLNASPMLIGERTTNSSIEDGVIYFRYQIPVISSDTFKDYLLEEISPFLFAAPGGLYVHMDGELIKDIREKNNISLGTLAEIAGVSRRTIQMYEDGMGVMADVALKIEEFLKTPIILSINPIPKAHEIEWKGPSKSENFEEFMGLEKEVYVHLNILGYNIVPTSKSPFEALTKDRKNLILTGVEKRDKNMVNKAKVVTDISKIVERQSVIFVEKSSKICLEGTPLINKKELKGIDSSEDVIELILERSKS